jgi:hypothetical protein
VRVPWTVAGAALEVHVEADRELEIDDDCGPRPDRRAAAVELTVADGADACFHGPVVGPGGEYDVLDHVLLLRVGRSGAGACLEGDGPSLRPRFVREQDNHVLMVDAAVCP